MVETLLDWMLSWSESPYGTIALFLISFAESSFFPLPPDILLMALVLGNSSMGLWFASVTTAGSVLGGMFGYFIGLKGGKIIVEKMLTPEKLRMCKNYFDRFDAWAIGIAGFTPVPYKVFTISAGAFSINFSRFFIASFISRGGRFFIVAILLQMLGPGVKLFIEKYFNILSILFIVLLLGGFYLLRVFSKKMSREGA